jgi:hypothetical protein
MKDNLFSLISTYLVDIPDFSESDRTEAFNDLKARQTAIQNLIYGQSDDDILEIIEESTDVDAYINNAVANIDFAIRRNGLC